MTPHLLLAGNGHRSKVKAAPGGHPRILSLILRLFLQFPLLLLILSTAGEGGVVSPAAPRRIAGGPGPAQLGPVPAAASAAASALGDSAKGSGRQPLCCWFDDRTVPRNGHENVGVVRDLRVATLRGVGQNWCPHQGSLERSSRTVRSLGCQRPRGFSFQHAGNRPKNWLSAWKRVQRTTYIPYRVRINGSIAWRSSWSRATPRLDRSSSRKTEKGIQARVGVRFSSFLPTQIWSPFLDIFWLALQRQPSPRLCPACEKCTSHGGDRPLYTQLSLPRPSSPATTLHVCYVRATTISGD